ncbi:MAG: hypothetical protein V4505_00630 [Pseudomonadota bacterium]
MDEATGSRGSGSGLAPAGDEDPTDVMRQQALAFYRQLWAEQAGAAPDDVMPWPPVGSVSEARMTPGGPPSGMNRDGTFSLRGDRATLRAQLDKAGITMFLPIEGGLMIGRSQAQKAQEMVDAAQRLAEPSKAPSFPAVDEGTGDHLVAGAADGTHRWASLPATAGGGFGETLVPPAHDRSSDTQVALLGAAVGGQAAAQGALAVGGFAAGQQPGRMGPPGWDVVQDRPAAGTPGLPAVRLPDLSSVGGRVAAGMARASPVLGAALDIGGMAAQSMLSRRRDNEDGTWTRPPPESIPIDETKWSGNHGEIKHQSSAGGNDNVRVTPEGDVWVQRPTGSWELTGNANDMIGANTPSGRRGKDRDSDWKKSRGKKF